MGTPSNAIFPGADFVDAPAIGRHDLLRTGPLTFRIVHAAGVEEFLEYGQGDDSPVAIISSKGPDLAYALRHGALPPDPSALAQLPYWDLRLIGESAHRALACIVSAQYAYRRLSLFSGLHGLYDRRKWSAVPALSGILYFHTAMRNQNPDGTLIVESNCRACRHFAYLGYVRGALQASPGCRLWLTGFPDTKLCAHYEREAGSDDE